MARQSHCTQSAHFWDPRAEQLFLPPAAPCRELALLHRLLLPVSFMTGPFNPRFLTLSTLTLGEFSTPEKIPLPFSTLPPRRLRNLI